MTRDTIRGKVVKILPDVSSDYGSGKKMILLTDEGEELRFTHWDAHIEPQIGMILTASKVKTSMVKGKETYSASGGYVSVDSKSIHGGSQEDPPNSVTPGLPAPPSLPVTSYSALMHVVKKTATEIDHLMKYPEVAAEIMKAVVEGVLYGTVALDSESVRGETLDDDADPDLGF